MEDNGVVVAFIRKLKGKRLIYNNLKHIDFYLFLKQLMSKMYYKYNL